MLELLGFLFFISIPLGLFYVGYKVKNNAADSTDLPEDKVILHGHDLAKWNYLGYSRCSYVDENGKTTSEYPIFLFSSKKNSKIRSYFIANDSSGIVRKSHSFVTKYIDPWAAGEGEMYARISGKGNCPSDYLRQYMLDTFSCEWDSATNWWGTSDKAKYNSAKNKQTRERKSTEDTTASDNTNVISVSFNRGDGSNKTTNQQ